MAADRATKVASRVWSEFLAPRRVGANAQGHVCARAAATVPARGCQRVEYVAWWWGGATVCTSESQDPLAGIHRKISHGGTRESQRFGAQAKSRCADSVAAEHLRLGKNATVRRGRRIRFSADVAASPSCSMASSTFAKSETPFSAFPTTPNSCSASLADHLVNPVGGGVRGTLPRASRPLDLLGPRAP